MNKLLTLVLLLALFSCKEESKTLQEPKTVEVEINRTIETFMILRSIAEKDPLFQYRDSTYLGKPIMVEARRAFADYKNHPAVEATQELLSSTSSTGDLILQGLLYFEELPSTAQKFEIDSDYWSARTDSLANYVETISQFYQKANVEAFVQENQEFYDQAIAEAKSYLSPALIPTMEGYFGIENHGYRMILIPNSPFGMGFGAKVNSEEGEIFYQIISPANEIEWNENSVYSTYGFSGEGAKEYYRDMVVHEFCHPFVTPYIETKELKAEIAKTDTLFVAQLDSIMSQQGYSTWWAFVNEHLVRLGEIRVANAMGIEDIDEMRRFNIEENGFVLLPDAEELVLQYENNRDTYPTFREFLPVLIEQLETFDRQVIDQRLQPINN